MARVPAGCPDFLFAPVSSGVHPLTGEEQRPHSFPHEHSDQGPSGFLYWRKVQNLHGRCAASPWPDGRRVGGVRFSRAQPLSPLAAPQIAMVSPGMASCEYTMNTLRYADRFAFRFRSRSLEDW